VDETHEMRWTEYAVSLLLFSVVSMLVLYAMQRLQAVLPLNPQGFAGVRQTWPSTRPCRSRPTRTGRPTAASRP
jgi:K+-transporting ATPase ATPase A chain